MKTTIKRSVILTAPQWAALTKRAEIDGIKFNEQVRRAIDEWRKALAKKSKQSGRSAPA